ncbi:hypothetical protein GSI_13074 [Ganoderma sinense ZZ0214-1]|uniref:F-box domain-containing protein n=1 Tax=Ganoderma sinense ZZ0214-1 TaxID=1077348 RepID=A0A2G8RUJ6_9APHY|nr:hypothetical protein GSI_13074 [Ganoderma sinense ZZ0214-1]
MPALASQSAGPEHSEQSYGIFDLPDEVLLQIVRFLGFEDITTLRKTSTRLSVVTQDRSAWLQMLRAQSRSLPLPYHLKNPSSWMPLASEQIQRTVRRLHIVDHTWLLPRSTYFVPGHSSSCALDPLFMNEDGSRTIYSIDIFLDRWLLCIYHEKLVELWDLDSVLDNPHKPVLCTSQQLKGVGSFSSAITHIDEQGQVLIIAVSCHELCHVLQVELHPSSAILRPQRAANLQDIQLRVIALITFASPIFCLRALDPAQSLLLLGLPSSFHLLNWNTNERTIVNMLSEEEEELWNGVVQATFLTPRHILVLKAHSLEVCTLLDSPQARMNDGAFGADPDLTTHHRLPTQMSAAVHSHFFPSTTFRGVSFSRPTVHHPTLSDPADEPTRVTLSFLAYDVLRGLFHCSVLVVIPQPDATLPSHSRTHISNPPIDVQVRLLAAHNMAIPLAPSNEAEDPVARSGFSHGTRGFVSACALGPDGTRGVWVERRRGAVRRVVYGFGAHNGRGEDDSDEDDDDSDTDSFHSDGVEFEGPRPVPSKKVAQKKKKGSKKRTMEGFQPGTPISVHNSELDIDPAHDWHTQAPHAIEGKEVYDVNSYDLRDDITHIAFSETTGLIALGTRKGDIRVLGRGLVLCGEAPRT